MEVLKAIGAEKVHEEQIGRVPVQHVGRDVGDHVVPEKALRELRPLAQSIDRKAERAELAPHLRIRGALEDTLVLEERQIEVETGGPADRKSTRLNSSHRCISYAVFCLKKK